MLLSWTYGMNSKCPKKIPENDCNFLKFQSFFGFFFFLAFAIYYFIFVNGIKFLDVTTTTDRKIRTEFRFLIPKKKIQKMTEILKSCHFREFFYFIFVNGIKFLDDTTTTDRKIRTEFRF